MAKRVTAFLSFYFCIRFIYRIINCALLGTIAVDYY